MAATTCSSCGGPRSPGSSSGAPAPSSSPGRETWCAWCDSIADVTAAQNEAFKFHDQALANQRARAVNTYRSQHEINPLWIAGIVMFVMLAIVRLACR